MPCGCYRWLQLQYFFEVDQQVQSAFTQSNSLSFLLGALIVYGAIHFAQKNLYFALYKITLPIIAIGVFLGVISCAISQQALSACAQIVILSGSRAATMVLWLICIFVASYKKFSVTWICSGLFFGLFAGRSLGIITGETIFLYTNQGEFVIGSIQFLMLYATAAILSESNELDPSSNSSWQSASLSTAKANDEDLLKATLDTITENHGAHPTRSRCA